MSTLKVTNLQDTAGANSATTAQIYNGIAKAWVNFNGTGTVEIRTSFNVSSITDNGTGTYTVNFTTAMVIADYAAMGCTSLVAAGTESPGLRMLGPFNTNSCHFDMWVSGVKVDSSFVTFACFS